MLITFDKFYRERGIRLVTGLTQTRVWPNRQLPRGSVLHHLNTETGDFPDPSHPFIQFSDKRVLLTNHYQLLEENNSIGKKIFQPVNLMQAFIRANQKFIKFDKPLSEAKDVSQLVVVNYNFVEQQYRYNEKTKMTPWLKYRDYAAMFWKNIADATKLGSRHHFVMVSTPEGLPSKSKLNMYSDKSDTEIIKYFDTDSARMLLDIWRWINPKTREHSSLKVIEKNDLHKVNLVFSVRDGRTAVINLAYLYNWIDHSNFEEKPADALIEERVRFSKREAPDIQLLFLKFNLNIQTMNVAILSEERESETAKEADRQEGDSDLEGDGSEPNRRNSSEMGDKTFDQEVTHSDELLQDFKGKKSKGSPGGQKVSGSGEFKDDTGGDTPDAESTKELEEELRILEEQEERRIQLKSDKVEQPDYDPSIPDSIEDIRKEHLSDLPDDEALMKLLDKAGAKGNISVVDFRKIQKALVEQEKKKDPFGSGKSLREMTVITDEDVAFEESKIKFADNKRVLDKSMLASCTENMDAAYIKKLMKKDVISGIMGIQRLGVLVSDIQHETVHSALGSFESFSVVLKPYDGRSSTIRFKYPTPQEDGTFKSNNVRYHMRKQRTDLPFRKTGPERVCLSSYIRKMFVYKSPKKARSSTSKIVDVLTKASIGEIPFLNSVRPANVFDKAFEAPTIYNVLASKYKSFNVKHQVFGEFIMDFEHKTRFEMFDEKTISSIEKNGIRVCGKTKKGRPVYVDMKGEFFTHNENGPQPLGNIYDILEIDEREVPVDPAEMKIMGQSIPVGLILARSMGLKKLLKLSGAKYRMVKGRQQKNLQPNEYAVSFADYSLIFDRNDTVSSLIFGGFTHSSKLFKAYGIASFERKDVYDDIIVSMGGNVVLCRDLDYLENGFIDPITRDDLKRMGEPTTFNELLIRACEELRHYNHPETQDLSQQKVRGYERFAGFIHKQLSQAVREFRNRNLSGRSRIEMSPFAVWQTIAEDRSVKTCEDINPLKNIAMHDSVTFAGEGGRSKETFLKDSRAFSENDANVFSEASVDSADVGYNLFLSSNPQFENLRGVIKKEKEDGPATYLSPSLLCAVGAEHADQKRNVFVSIQNAHTISCHGARQPYVQTGAEMALANRTDDLFCYTAKEEGVIESLTETGVIVVYKSGERRGVQLGRRYGNAEGSTYPHDIVPNVKQGQKVKVGDIIAFNTGFWERDFIEPEKVVMKVGMSFMTMFDESTVTHEDSCSISNKLLDNLVSKTTKVRNFTLRFGQNVHDVQKPGAELSPDTILMSIENEITAGTNLFDSESASHLSSLSRDNPLSSYKGRLDRIEVLYNGEKSDMSPSLKALADRSDRQMVEECKATNKPVVNGRVTGDYRVAGKNLQLDTMEIKFYITVENAMGPGDKAVFGNQLKTTVGETRGYSIVTESGTEVEATFGGASCIKRIVVDYLKEGTTTRILKFADKKAVELYNA